MDLGEEGGVAGVFVVKGQVEFGCFLEGAAEVEDGFGGGGVTGWGNGDVLLMEELCQSRVSFAGNRIYGAVIILGHISQG